MSDPAQKKSSGSAMLSAVGWSRYITILAVFGTFVGAIFLLIAGTLDLLSAIFSAFASIGEAHMSGHLKIELVETVDTFLVAIVLIVIALGLYQLFVSPIDGLPPWLRAHGVGDLEKRLAGMVITVLAVIFLIQAVQWDSGIDILWIGLSIGAVIVAVAYFLRIEETEPDHEE